MAFRRCMDEEASKELTWVSLDRTHRWWKDHSGLVWCEKRVRWRRLGRCWLGSCSSWGTVTARRTRASMQCCNKTGTRGRADPAEPALMCTSVRLGGRGLRRVVSGHQDPCDARNPDT